MNITEWAAIVAALAALGVFVHAVMESAKKGKEKHDAEVREDAISDSVIEGLKTEFVSIKQSQLRVEQMMGGVTKWQQEHEQADKNEFTALRKENAARDTELHTIVTSLNTIKTHLKRLTPNSGIS